jgi:hypothetical protein
MELVSFRKDIALAAKCRFDVQFLPSDFYVTQTAAATALFDLSSLASSQVYDVVADSKQDLVA